MFILLFVFFSVQSADAASRNKQMVESLLSPPGNHPIPPIPSASSSPSMSPSDRSAFIQRRCSLIREESIEEEDDDVDLDSPHKAKHSRSAEGYTSDESDSRSNKDSTESPQRAPPAPRRQQKVRPLHSVRSSPQLLNQIFEEGESDEEDILPLVPSTHNSPHLHRSSVGSPEVLRKYQHHSRKKRLTKGSRGTSCSSSDASDTDDADNHKRKEKLKQRLHRRDSSDHSSDTDGPSGPGGPGGSGRHFRGGGSGNDRNDHQDKDNNDRDKNNDDNRKSQKREGRHSGGGKQNGLLPSKKDSSGSENNTGTNTPTDLCRKISNMSLASNLSNLSLTSLTSRGSKYVVGDSSENNTPKRMGSTKSEIDALNEENKARTRVIHVRSKEFTDLVDRFNSGKEEISQLKEPGVKFRRRPKDKMKTDINRNGLIARADGEVESNTGQEGNVVKTKCCSLV